MVGEVELLSLGKEGTQKSDQESSRYSLDACYFSYICPDYKGKTITRGASKSTVSSRI